MSSGIFAVIDGSSLFFRAFYALQLPPNARGIHTNAVHGFAMMLVKLLKELSPTQIVIAFDKSRTTFRTALYPDYKGTRDKTPEELIAQIPLLKELAEALGIPFLERDDYEADDIIGTLAAQAAAEGVETRVITGDRDALQLIRPQLTVLLTKKGISETKAYDTAAFEEEYGFPPIRLIDMKGLMGDSSDNIPGVPGVGPKTATKLLLAYESIENVLDHAAEVSGKKLSTSLVEYREQALLSKQLATIECHVPELHYEAEAFRMQPDRAALEAFCHAYELRTVWRALSEYLGAAEAPASAAAQQSLFGAPAPAADLTAAEFCDADMELLRTAEKVAVGAVFAGTPPFVEVTTLALVMDGERRILSASSSHFAAILACLAERSVALWNAKRYVQAGLRGTAQVFDLELADYLLHPEESRRDMARAAFAFLSDTTSTEGLSPEAYAVHEALLSARLQPVMETELAAQGLMQLYRTVELPLVPVLAAMEQTGVCVNRTALEHERAAATERIDALEQLGLGDGKVKKTKTGYSTNAETLEGLHDQHPIIDKVLTYRMWTKLRSTYLDGIGALIRPATGRVHTSFNQTVTATGRLSSSDPNLQNIPVRTEEGRAVRALFTPGEGYDALLSADYSQIELRILAHMSGDATLIDAFRQGQDIHARTAAEVFGVPLDAVTPEQRRRAKAVNFGIVYGLSDFGLARDLGIGRREAGGYIDRYFERYHGVRTFLDKIVADAHESGYVTTLYGRRRALPAAGVKSHILLQVHDELVLEVTAEEMETVTELLRTAMSGAAELAVPLAVDVHRGKNWAEAK